MHHLPERGKHPPNPIPQPSPGNWWGFQVVRKIRGAQSHGFVQGSRDDHGRDQGSGERRQGNSLRQHWKYQRLRSGLRLAGRVDMRCPDSRGKDILRKDGPSPNPRCQDNRDQRELRRCIGVGKGAGIEGRHRDRQQYQPIQDTGSEDSCLRDM